MPAAATGSGAKPFMQTIQDAFASALHLMISLNAGLIEIVLLSLRVSLTAVLCAALIGLPLGAALALFQFPGRRFAAILLSSLMGMPPVVVGLIVYLLLSRSGPLGVFGLLFSPIAMILAQIVIVTPIIAALTRQLVEDLWTEYREQLQSLGCGHIDHVTRMMTTAIALETSKGDLALALGLGIILIVLSLGVNGAAFVIRDLTGRHP